MNEDEEDDTEAYSAGDDDDPLLGDSNSSSSPGRYRPYYKPSFGNITYFIHFYAFNSFYKYYLDSLVISVTCLDVCLVVSLLNCTVLLTALVIT